ncbi:hypothetical protein GCM10027447_35250 [Glycomyces halotolerans]
MSPQYDPDAIRDVGKWTIPTLATAYERFESLVVQAGAELDTGGVSEAMSRIFTNYHLLLRNAIAETQENYAGLGPKLVAIADDDEVSDDEVTRELENLGQDVSSDWSEQGYEPMGPGDDTESLEAAPSAYDAELDGEQKNEED